MTGAEICGIYMLTASCDSPTRNNGTRLQLQLEDGTGSIRGFVWPECRGQVEATLPFTAVRIQAQVDEYQGAHTLRVRQLQAVPADQIAGAACLLPLNRCPVDAQPAMQRLIALERSLPEPLAGFLRRVLLDPQIGVPFLVCRASVAHHHDEPGGLLVHSTEFLDEIGSVVRKALSGDAESVHLAQLGYLLHDLGKIRTVGELQRPLHGRVIRHEYWTLLLLASHLDWLVKQDRRLAMGLMAILDHALKAPKERAHGTCDYFPAEAVMMFDQMSAASYSRRDLNALLRGSSRGGASPMIRNAAPAANDPFSEVGHAAEG